jgi:hypothetical protein
MPGKKQLFCDRGVQQNCHAFDDNVRAILVFIKQIFRTAEKASPSPHSAVQGVGYLLFFLFHSREFG